MKIDAIKAKLLKAKWTINLVAVVAIVGSLNFWPQPAHAEWRTLTGVLPAHVNSPTFEISPDSRTVVIRADIDTDDVNELYSVPVTGTAPIKLNPPLIDNGNIRTFLFTPDSQFVIYIADQEVDNREELYRVPVGGGEAVKLNPPLPAGGNVLQMLIDGKNGRVVYTADQATNDVLELWSVPIAGGTSVKLNSPFVAGGNIVAFQLDPLSNRVVYSADQEVNGKSELYSVLVGGGGVRKLNPPIVLTGGGDGGIGSQFAVSPALPVVVFIARQADELGGRLYSFPTAGDINTEPGLLNLLSFNLLDTQRIIHFRISPVGDKVVFLVGTRDGSTNAFKGKLYSNLIGAGGAAEVSESPDPTFGADILFQILPDGSRVVYNYQEDADSTVRLVSATLLGTGRVNLYAPTADDDPLIAAGFRLSNDSDWVMYQTSNGGVQSRIFTVPPIGGSSVSHGVVRFSFLSPDSARIGYTKVVSGANNSELFSAQIFGGGERNLSGMEGTGAVSDTKISPDSKWIVFLAQLGAGLSELRVSDGEEAQPSVTPSPSESPSESPSASPSPSVSPSASPSVSPSPSATNETPTPFLSHLPALSKDD